MKRKEFLQKFDIIRLFGLRGQSKQAPGTVEYVGKKRQEPISIQVMDYTKSSFTEKKIDDISMNLPYVKDDSVTWININGVYDPDLIRKVGKVFGISSLVLEDIANTTQRPKMEEYPDYFFLVLKMAYEDKEETETHLEQVNLLVSKGLVISFQEREGDVFEVLRQRIRRDVGIIREQKADYLAYAIVDLIVDNYFPVLESLGEQIEKLENELLDSSRQKQIERVYRLKQEVVSIRQIVWPLRDLVRSMLRSEHHDITKVTKDHLRDVYDHVLQVVDAVEIFREMAADMVELYLSMTSHRTNQVMKVLTIFASIFIPLTFIASVYGMNFRFLPGVYSPYGYIGVFAVMFGLAIAMVIYFRIKKWF